MANLLERDWQFVREGAQDLERYLLSPELYWPLPGMSGGRGPEGMLQFTLGNLDLSQARLAAVNWPAKEQAELEEINGKVEAVHAHWKVNWARKAAREHTARLKLWQDYLADLLPEPGRRMGGYAFEVRLRTILQILRQDVDTVDPTEQAALAGLDSRLRGKTQPGPFVWEPEVQPAFPQEPYWYLYVTFNQ